VTMNPPQLSATFECATRREPAGAGGETTPDTTLALRYLIATFARVAGDRCKIGVAK